MNAEPTLSLSTAVRVEQLRAEFEAQYHAGQTPRIEDFLVQMEDSARRHLLNELLRVEVELRRRAGKTPQADEYRLRFPYDAEQVEQVLDDTINKSASGQSSELAVSQVEVGLLPIESFAKTASAAIGGPAGDERIGRYRIERELGSGGFGQVLLARDEELQRHVAIKIPRLDRDFSQEEVTLYLTEARTLASLDHPHIVPVHDVGRTVNGHPYIVTKYIEGSDLAERMARGPVTAAEAAHWTATVAEALHYAHKRGLVHRDIKPGNILLDLDGNPYVVDFGLALKESDLGKGPRLAGTIAFMSPEQARGESHRVDGRSDIYSLGAVLYQLLVGRRTFTADNRDELLELIAQQEPKPPRQIDDRIPKELERICLKALSPRTSDRYTTAKDMADDLRAYAMTLDDDSYQWAAFFACHAMDRPAVAKLAERLRSDGVECLVDNWNVGPGQSWVPGIEEALKKCSTLCVFVGTQQDGPWHHESMLTAILRRVHKSPSMLRIIPVLLPGATRGDRMRLPPFLVSNRWVEFAGSLDDNEAYLRLKCAVLNIPTATPSSDFRTSLFCPYRGLEVFDREHASVFFGRDAQIDWMIERLKNGLERRSGSRFLGVVGASGSGKSSLVRAGLVPALARGGSRTGKTLAGSAEWPMVIFKPGTEPLKALADALWTAEGTRSVIGDTLELSDKLKQDERRLHATIGTSLHGMPEHHYFMIVVDQFEEIFTMGVPDDERRAFIDNLLYASSQVGGRVVVVTTTRADFYGHCSNYSKLAVALSEQQEVVCPMTSDELRLAIHEPAELCGLTLEAGLTELLLQDMENQSNALPLLQYALKRLWEQRDGQKLTVAAYRRMQGMSGALRQRAEELFRSFDTNEQESCKRVFLRLVHLGNDMLVTRRRVAVDQWDQAEPMQQVVDRLVQARLITTGSSSSSNPSGHLELSHEALIQHWPRLRDWIDSERESLRISACLSEDARRWEANRADDSYLYRGSRLLEVSRWSRSTKVDLGTVEQKFLDASHAAEQRERRIRAAAERPLSVSVFVWALRLAGIVQIFSAAVLLLLFLGGNLASDYLELPPGDHTGVVVSGLLSVGFALLYFKTASSLLAGKTWAFYVSLVLALQWLVGILLLPPLALFFLPLALVGFRVGITPFVAKGNRTLIVRKTAKNAREFQPETELP